MTETAVDIRSCRYCGTEMELASNASCPSCGWYVGIIPVGESRDAYGNMIVHFAPEPRIRWGRLSLIMFTFGGLIAFFAGINQNIGISLLGLLAAILGIIVWKETKFGRIMYGLTPSKRMLARFVITIGIIIIWCTLIGFILAFFGDRMIRKHL